MRTTQSRFGTVTLIGAGAVARSFAASLPSADGEIVSIYSQRGTAARTLARRFGVKNSGVLGPSVVVGTVIVICVPDDAINDVVKQLKRMGTPLKGRTVLHTSGGTGSDILSPLKEQGAFVGSIHPLQTFPRTGPVTSLRGVPCAVEGDRKAIQAAMSIARRTRMHPFRITPKNKPLYHAAAVFASNYPVVMLGVMEEIAQQSGVTKKDVLPVFAPLVERSISNALRLGPATALTGPAARGDRTTMERHRAALRMLPDGKRMTELYDILAREAGRQAKRKRR